MPKLVDHDQRRRELVQAALRIIARQGLSGATMRDIAAEAGFANGIINSYFGSKSDLLAATYLEVFTATNHRIAQLTAGLRGLDALRAFYLEVLPVSDALRDEARVVLSYFGEVWQQPEHAEATAATVELWRGWVANWLSQAREAGELHAAVDAEREAELILDLVLGAQVSALLGGEQFSAERVRAQLEYLLVRVQA